MDTDLSGDAGAWPWSALGIAPTADKAAIHAAHEAKRAELNAKAARISEFADLTAARGKALFLASEMQRESEREGTADKVAPVVDEPAAPVEAQPEPAPAEREPGGRFSSATDSFHEPPDTPGDRQFAEDEVQGSSDWEHSGGYKPDLPATNDAFAEDLAKLAGIDATQKNEADGSWSGPGPTPLLERYSLDRYGFFWLLGLFLLLAFCSGR